MNKKLKKILIYIVPLLIGIGLAVLLYKLESIGRKNNHKTYIKTLMNHGPDSLRNHFPEINLLETATFSTISPQDKVVFGGGYIIVNIEKNDSLNNLIRKFVSENNSLIIDKTKIFNLDLNYKERRIELSNYSGLSEFPFPKFIHHENFDNYKLVFYEFGNGIYLRENQIKENKHIDSKWKHGYTRGIAESQGNEFVFWLMVW